MRDLARAEATRLLLLRHGEVEEGARGRIYGRLDPALSETGRAQAEAIGRRVAPEHPVAIYTSPSLRARDTAAPLAAALGLAPIADERLREIGFGDFEGLTFAEAERRDPVTWREWMERPGEVRFPGGECWEDVRARAVDAAEAIAAAHPAVPVAVVTHGGVVRALLAEALAIPASRTFRMEVGFGSLTVLRREPFGWMVEAVNRRP
ncbi:MAG TPA: histidine phosphatase family protein [Anaeromyxobacteraceae bacterium]|nr:histidine phosphatase family protein [Anaeromyxobacteraceae bacterium]